MNTALLVPFITTALSGVGVYTHYHFKKYQASKDQCLKVRKMMENTLTDTAILFSMSAPTQALKSDLRIMLKQLSQEARKLDDMTIRLPIMRLQREQRHVLRHADWLLVPAILLHRYSVDEDCISTKGRVRRYGLVRLAALLVAEQ